MQAVSLVRFPAFPTESAGAPVRGKQGHSAPARPNTAADATVIPAAPAPASGSVPTALCAPEEPAWKRVLDYAMHSGHILIESAEVAGVLAGAAVGGAVGAGIVSVGMTALGLSHLAQAARNKCGEQLVEGVGSTLIGVKSAVDALTMATSHAQGASFLLAPLGVAHGSAEAILGAYRVGKGIKGHDRREVIAGGFSLGLGASTCAAALGGGLPALIAAGLCLAGRIVCEESTRFNAARNGVQPQAKPREWRFLAA